MRLRTVAVDPWDLRAAHGPGPDDGPYMRDHASPLLGQFGALLSGSLAEARRPERGGKVGAAASQTGAPAE